MFHTEDIKKNLKCEMLHHQQLIIDTWTQTLVHNYNQSVSQWLDLTVPPHLRDERADLVLYLHEAAKATLHDGGEVEETQCVTGRSRVKDHHREIHSFH